MIAQRWREIRETVPAAGDARWRQLAFHGTFVTYALTSPAFNRRPSLFLAGFFTCVIADLLGMYARDRRVYFPISGAITSFGLLLLCDSAYPWVYAYLGLLSIASKYVVRVNGRHVFNPSNFGIVVALLTIPQHMIVASGRWGGAAWGMAGVALLGTIVCSRAGRLAVAASYAVSFFLGSLLLHAIQGLPLAMCLAPMTGATFAVFTFFMITDPQTSPNDPRYGALFGASIGVIETLLRSQEVLFAHFFTLFGMTVLLAAARFWRDRRRAAAPLPRPAAA